MEQLAVAGLMLSVVGLAVTTAFRTRAAFMAIQLERIAVAERACKQIRESLLAIEAARADDDDTGRMSFEVQYLLLTIEAYRADINVLGAGTTESDKLVVAALRQLVPVICASGDGLATPGELFRRAGFPEAAKLADEQHMKCS
ncbi:MAG: hypothetical protein OXQ29_09130 [Rhodospirillaceae bacterium]|nr:hypothetical protein [Rhodospirillaceae bacterium]